MPVNIFFSWSQVFFVYLFMDYDIQVSCQNFTHELYLHEGRKCSNLRQKFNCFVIKFKIYERKSEPMSFDDYLSHYSFYLMIKQSLPVSKFSSLFKPVTSLYMVPTACCMMFITTSKVLHQAVFCWSQYSWECSSHNVDT